MNERPAPGAPAKGLTILRGDGDPILVLELTEEPLVAAEPLQCEVLPYCMRPGSAFPLTILPT